MIRRGHSETKRGSVNEPVINQRPKPACGPLPAHINAYLKFPEERGYKQHTIRPDSLLLTDLDDWLVRKGHRVIDLNETMLERFLRYAFSQAVVDLWTPQFLARLSWELQEQVRSSSASERPLP